MAWEPKEGSGYIFDVAKRTEKGPIMRGECLYEGKMVEIAIWPPREGKKGVYFALKAKEERQPKEEQAPKPQTGVADMDSDIPF